jgi:hypothetical protein
MSLTVGKYTFNAWLRRGIGVQVNEADTLGAGGGAVKERATVPVDVQVNAQPVHKDFALLAPGDVIGISPDAVVRTEPRDWVTEFEPNYLAFIEFYEEDLPWRYTPAHPVGDRLRPWLALVVLEEPAADDPGEFAFSDRRLPLPSITVASTASLAPPAQTWSWAHVHTNDDFPTATDFERFLESLETSDDPNRDRIIARLVCPRHLRPNTAYGAFVVPAFETGRLAGLGQDAAVIAATDAQQPAWTSAAGSVELPVYYQWRFRTGENEDFESLVKRLVPRPADPSVGVRLMDGEKPGWGMTNPAVLGPVLPADEKQSAVGLEGALKAPTTQARPTTVDPTLPFFGELEQKLNQAADRQAAPASENLPVITPPIYGQYHALRDRVDVTQPDWLDALNRDPRTRVPAGFGVRIVQENQEDYVARAWAMVQTILAANRVVRLLAFAMYASQAIHANFAARLDPAGKLPFYSPVLRKIRGSPTTLQHQLGLSTLPPAAVSGAMRRLVRPRGAIARRVQAADAAFTHGGLIAGMAQGHLTAAPPKPVPGDLATDAGATARLTPPPTFPGWLRWLTRHWQPLLIAVLVVLLLVGLVSGGWLLPNVLAGAALIAAWALDLLARRITDADQAAAVARLDPQELAQAVAQAPPRPSFGLVETDPAVPPQAATGTQVTTGTEQTSSSASAIELTTVTTFTPGAATGADSVEARSFRTAATALGQRLSLTVDAPSYTPFDLANADTKLTAAVDPRTAFPLRAAATVKFGFDPAWLLKPEHLVPAMAYPDFDDPMYAKLRDISSELLLPNLQLIPPDTLTLLETNPPFIESYLVGLNYEFGQELLWSEYPTDRRGSYFRQFWDVRGIIAEPSDATPAEIAERGRDVTPLDQWGSASQLGTHRNPLQPPGEQVVLAVRGELLKKYPNTLIYAQKAHLALDANGRPLPDPVVAEVASDADVAREIKFPAFKATVDPDIAFFGFGLTAEQARGDDHPQTAADDWGWYFVIQQLPGEPRFGMDVSFSPDDDPATPLTWDDLAWTLFPGGPPFIDTGTPPQGLTPAGPGESLAQWGTDSARMASILFQRPVMILVHAKEMLEGLG